MLAREAVDVQRLRVSGMTCASCAVAVETALRKAPGVLDATVSLLAAAAEVGGSCAALHPAHRFCRGLRRIGRPPGIASRCQGCFPRHASAEPRSGTASPPVRCRYATTPTSPARAT